MDKVGFDSAGRWTGRYDGSACRVVRSDCDCGRIGAGRLRDIQAHGAGRDWQRAGGREAGRAGMT